jgi:uncharacterized UPF0160 family protein
LTEFFGWKAHIHAAEKAVGADIKFIVYNSGENDWRCQAIPVEDGSFTSKLPLHPDWRGIRDE